MAFFSSFWMYDILLLIVAGLALTYAYFRYQWQKWQKRGFSVPLEPSFPFGNYTGVHRTKTIELITADIYQKTHGEKMVGVYFLNKPLMIIKDMELTKNILVKDFAHFHDRGFEIDTKKEPLGAHLLFLNGQEWRNLRIKLTPTFTTGKMRMMFPTLMEVGQQLEEIFEKATNEEETEIKEILSRYTTDVISSVAFGIETNSLKNPDAEFRKMGLEITHPNFRTLVAGLILAASPWLANNLPLSLMPPHLSTFFTKIVQETMDYREKNNIQRNDFLQLLLQLKTLGYVKDADNPQNENEDPEKQQKFTLQLAASQAFLFFFAGFETSSSTMQFALYELALNPDLQKLAQEDVDQAKAKNGGLITYDAVMQMEFLDRVVAETLRKYPVASLLMRKCGKEYPIQGTDLTFQPGDAIWFSVYGIHHDPQYYPEPEKFDPDRFLPEVKEKRPHYAYLPFGEGPRNCIGNRFGLMQTKTGLALILSRFNLSPSKKTPIPMEFSAKTNVLAPKEGVHLKISYRKNLNKCD